MTEDRPIGPPVEGPAARAPGRVSLAGRFVDLVPLEDRHADPLFETAGGAAGRDLWTYMPDGPYPEPDAFRAAIARKAASADPLFFAILDKRGRVVGHAALMRMQPADRAIEVGNILYGTALQRTPGATEAMALLAGYVFDTLGYRRYEWKCNDLNAPSKAAARRLGFTFEGVFRQHMIVKGRNRDTAWFSMLDGEWPARRAALAAWLAPENFDAAGRQRSRLGAVRAEG